MVVISLFQRSYGVVIRTDIDPRLTAVFNFSDSLFSTCQSACLGTGLCVLSIDKVQHHQSHHRMGTATIGFQQGHMSVETLYTGSLTVSSSLAWHYSSVDLVDYEVLVSASLCVKNLKGCSAQVDALCWLARTEQMKSTHSATWLCLQLAGAQLTQEKIKNGTDEWLLGFVIKESSKSFMDIVLRHTLNMFEVQLSTSVGKIVVSFAVGGRDWTSTLTSGGFIWRHLLSGITMRTGMDWLKNWPYCCEIAHNCNLSQEKHSSYTSKKEENWNCHVLFYLVRTQCGDISLCCQVQGKLSS